MLFGAVGTAIGLAEDLHRGLIERFRALPMARMAVLAGRTVSDLVRNVGVLLVITAVGFAIGFVPRGRSRLHRRVPLDATFAYCVSWGFAFHWARRSQLRDGPGDLVPGDLPPDLRLSHFCPGEFDARLVATLRQQSAGKPSHRRRARSHARHPYG